MTIEVGASGGSVSFRQNEATTYIKTGHKVDNPYETIVDVTEVCKLFSLTVSVTTDHVNMEVQVTHDDIPLYIANYTNLLTNDLVDIFPDGILATSKLKVQIRLTGNVGAIVRATYARGEII